MRFALVMPKSTFLEDSMVFGPLGLWYLASRLESLGHSVDYYDLNIDPIPDDNYDQIWVSATSPQMAEVKRIANVTQGYKAKRVLGGASVWASPESCKDIGYDLIVGGETDSPDNIEQVIHAFDNISYRKHNHLVLPISRTLDWVLPPSRRWVGKYHSRLVTNNGLEIPCTTMFTSRGCPLECAFCESGRHGVIWDRLTRYEPIESVEEQIREVATLGYHALAYYDDILPISKKRITELMALHQKYDMVWRCFLRSDIINNQGGYDYLREMRDGGLIEIFVGVESADNEIKNNITKKTTIEQDTNIVRWCKDLGIRCKTSFILGLPGETFDSMEKTRLWILENRPDRVQVGRLIPFPGTPLFKNIENYDIKLERNVDDDWFYSGKNDITHSFVSTSHLTVDEIDAYWHKLIREIKELGIPS